jgi:hypothetical protein
MGVRLRNFFVSAACAFFASGFGFAQSASVDASLAGWLDQFLLLGLPAPAPSLAADACAPACSVNAMVYLQNRYPEIYGQALAGGNLTSWAETAALLAGPGFFNTIPGVGTEPVANLPLGLRAFLSDRGFGGTQVGGILPQGNAGGLVNELVGALPAGYAQGLPTWEFLEGALRGGSPVIVSILYEGRTSGHNVLVTGLEWSGSGSAATGTMTFIDPLDPAFYNAEGMPIGMKLTTGNVTVSPELVLTNPENGVEDSLTNILALDYLQYQGSLPYETGNYSQAIALIGGATILQVPEPGVFWLLAAAGVAWVVWLRRIPR